MGLDGHPDCPLDSSVAQIQLSPKLECHSNSIHLVFCKLKVSTLCALWALYTRTSGHDWENLGAFENQKQWIREWNVDMIFYMAVYGYCSMVWCFTSIKSKWWIYIIHFRGYLDFKHQARISVISNKNVATLNIVFSLTNTICLAQY